MESWRDPLRVAAPGADREMLFSVIGVVAFIGYAAALWEISIWYGRAFSMTLKSTIDGLIYAAITSGTFMWLWPSGLLGYFAKAVAGRSRSALTLGDRWTMLCQRREPEKGVL